MPIRAGKLDRRVIVQREVAVQESDGFIRRTWVEVATVWAERVQGSGSEQFLGATGERTAIQQRQYRIRFMIGVTPKMRLVDEGGIWDIEDVLEEGRRDGLLLTCHAHEVMSGNPPPEAE